MLCRGGRSNLARTRWRAPLTMCHRAATASLDHFIRHGSRCRMTGATAPAADQRTFHRPARQGRSCEGREGPERHARLVCTLPGIASGGCRYLCAVLRSISRQQRICGETRWDPYPKCLWSQVLRLPDDRVACATGMLLPVCLCLWSCTLRVHNRCNAGLKGPTPQAENCSVFAVQVKDVEVNFSQMFVNTVEGLEAGGAQLQHVHFVSGTLNCVGTSQTRRLLPSVACRHTSMHQASLCVASNICTHVSKHMCQSARSKYLLFFIFTSVQGPSGKPD